MKELKRNEVERLLADFNKLEEVTVCDKLIVVNHTGRSSDLVGLTVLFNIALGHLSDNISSRLAMVNPEFSLTRFIFELLNVTENRLVKFKNSSSGLKVTNPDGQALYVDSMTEEQVMKATDKHINEVYRYVFVNGKIGGIESTLVSAVCANTSTGYNVPLESEQVGSTLFVYY